VSEFRTYRFVIDESRPDLTVQLSEGVEICEADTDNCVTTDANGRADLDVRANQEVAITFEKEGFGSRIVGDVSDETFGPDGAGDGREADFRMYPNEQLEAIAQQLGTAYPWEGGMVGLTLARTPLGFAGVTFTPMGPTSDAVGESFYYDANAEPEQYSLDLEATTAAISADLLPFGMGGFTEVNPGERQFAFGGTVDDCSLVSWGWPGDTPNTIGVPVREGFMTYGSMACD
jgi:hypothetical protein